MLPQSPGGSRLAQVLLSRQDESSERRVSRGSGQQRSFTYGELRRGQYQLNLPRGSATERTFTYGDGRRRRERRQGTLPTLPTLDEVILEGLSKRADSAATSSRDVRGGPSNDCWIEEARSSRRSSSKENTGQHHDKQTSWMKAKTMLLRSVPTLAGRGAIGEESERSSDASSRSSQRSRSSWGDITLGNSGELHTPGSSSRSSSDQQQRPQQMAYHSGTSDSTWSPLQYRTYEDAIRGKVLSQSTNGVVASARTSSNSSMQQQQHVSSAHRKSAVSLAESDRLFIQQQMSTTSTRTRKPSARGSGSESSFTCGYRSGEGWSSSEQLHHHQHTSSRPRGSGAERTFAYGDYRRTSYDAQKLAALESQAIQQLMLLRSQHSQQQQQQQQQQQCKKVDDNNDSDRRQMPPPVMLMTMMKSHKTKPPLPPTTTTTFTTRRVAMETASGPASPRHTHAHAHARANNNNNSNYNNNNNNSNSNSNRTGRAAAACADISNKRGLGPVADTPCPDSPTSVFVSSYSATNSAEFSKASSSSSSSSPSPSSEYGRQQQHPPAASSTLKEEVTPNMKMIRQSGSQDQCALRRGPWYRHCICGVNLPNE